VSRPIAISAVSTLETALGDQDFGAKLSPLLEDKRAHKEVPKRQPDVASGVRANLNPPSKYAQLMRAGEPRACS
jgi:hypothetical protein